MSSTPPPGPGPEPNGTSGEPASLSIENVLRRIEDEHSRQVNRLTDEWRRHHVEPTTHQRAEPAQAARSQPPPPRAPDPLPYYAVEPPDEENHRARWLIIAAALLVLLALLAILFVTSASSRSGTHAEIPQATSASGGSQPAAVQPTAGGTVAAAVPPTAAPTPSPVATQSSAPALVTSTPARTPPSTPTQAVSAATATSDPVQRAAAFQQKIQSGKLQVTADYGGGSSATADLSFDLGDNTHPPRLYLKTVYKSGQTTDTSERITIGDQAWERRPDGSWAAVQEQEGVWGRLQIYLPHMPGSQNVNVQSADDGLHLMWTDAGKQNTLVVDQTTGTPRELRQQNASPQLMEVVKYLEWNTPVDIRAP